MRSTTRGVILAAAAVVAIVTAIGIASAATAGSPASLPQITAEELLVRTAQSDHAALSVQGEVSWENGLFGALELPPDLAQAPAQSPLLSSGSGRIWMSEDGVRVESQGGGGDQIVAASKASRTVWTYDSASNTARRFDMKADGQTATAFPTPAATPSTPLSGAFLQRLAPYATLDVTGQTTVADRAAYVLRMIPLADDTALGKVEAAIDGETMLPLRLEVYAAGATQPALRFGFDSISYQPVAAALFEFTPPSGAEVTIETLEPEEQTGGAGATRAAGEERGESGLVDEAAREQLARQSLLTLDEAQELVEFRLARPRDYDARPFRHAYVANDDGFLTAAGAPLFGASGDSKERSASPSSALVYGAGFGAITLVQTRTTEDLTARLERLPALTQTSAADGAPLRAVFTPLGGAVIWQEGETTLMAAGLVTQADLEAFVRAVR